MQNQLIPSTSQNRRRPALRRASISRVPISSLAIAVALLAASCSSDGSDVSDAEDASGETTTSTAPVSTTTAPPETTTTEATTPEPAGLVGDVGSIGDPLFEGLGNSGYDIEHYDLTIDTTSHADAASGAINGVATIDLVPDNDLAVFHLDLIALEVSDVQVDGAAALFNHVENELIIEPAAALTSGQTTQVIVTYGGNPVPIIDATLFGPGWQTEDWGSYVVSEPNGASSWFPGNDHPLDKATFDIAITVPLGTVAVGPGALQERVVEGETETFSYNMPYQMATYLASVVVGDFVVDESEGPNGVTIRNVLWADDAQAMRPVLERTTGPMLQLFHDTFGPYPFDTYGIAAVPESLGYALENQTLSLFGVDTITFDSLFTEQILAHELAHQWFGDDVSPAEWDDIWLNEGFASWADAYWSESLGNDSFANLEAYNTSAALGPLKGRTVGTLFDDTVYVRGPLALESLRRTVGDEPFFDLLRTWVETYSGGTASTADFLSLVDQSFGEEAQQLMKAWIFDEASPALPAK